MIRLTPPVTLATAAGIALLSGGPVLAKSCARYGGDATMITEDLAKFMANAALKNSINGAGAKPQGAVKMTCSASGLVTCQARQVACK